MKHVFLTFYIIITIVIVPNYYQIIITNSIVYNFNSNYKIGMKLSNHKDNYILLVEDEKDILDLFTEYLSSSGFNTISFQNPIEALNYFYQNQSNCSLVIADYKMPEISGLELIKKIREKDTDCKIKTIMVSAYIKDNIPYDKSYNMKIDRILEKPVYLDRLKTEIQQLLTIDIKKKIS